MKRNVIVGSLSALLCTALGLCCGWWAGRREAAPAPAPTHDAGAPASLSPAALRNMGVATTKARLESFAETHPVAAVVTAAPGYVNHLYAPAAGRVAGVEARFGALAKGGETLVTLIREPLPRVDLKLTGEVLRPVSENLHDAFMKLRTAVIGVEILEQEQRRLSQFGRSGSGEAVLPKKELLQAEYDLRRARQELVAIQLELRRHGLTEAQIKDVGRGVLPEIDVKIWLGALRFNGFWTPRADALFKLLPERLRQLPWTAATVGELAAGGLSLEGLLAWVQKERAVGGYILEIGGLLQRGHSLADIRDLHGQGALEEVIRVRAPLAVADWDISDILVRPGGSVARGEMLVSLENPRLLYLRAVPSDTEISMALAAMKDKLALSARPLVPGAGPNLQGLVVRRLFQAGAQGRPALHIPLENHPLLLREDDGGGRYRTWQLRPGQRYLVDIPRKRYDRVYVFPAGTVVDDGADKVLFIRSGDSFTKVKVPLVHQDHRVVVLPMEADIFPDNNVVTSGAFALKLALEMLEGGGGAQGHGHCH